MLLLIVAQINERKPPALTGCLEQTGGGRRTRKRRSRRRSATVMPFPHYKVTFNSGKLATGGRIV